MKLHTRDKVLNRKEAAAHLLKMGFPVAPRTLASLAARGKGPPYIRFLHRITLYEVAELEAWAFANAPKRCPVPKDPTKTAA
jgi:hypothetical protein